MTIKEKLNLMDAIKASNEARDKEFLNESKSWKQWLVDYSAICEDGLMIESGESEMERLTITAPDIAHALQYANDLLTIVAADFRWKKWSVWNIGILDGEEIF